MTTPDEPPQGEQPVLRQQGPVANTTGRTLGIVAVIIMGVCVVLPVVVIMILMATLNEMYAYFLIPVIPFALVAAAAGFIVSIIGLVSAVRHKSAAGWPAAGLFLSVVLLAIGITLPFT